MILSFFFLGRSKKKERCLSEELHPLEETKPCPCDEFLSQPYGNWSACILPNPSVFESLQGWMVHREVKECGQGVRYRAVACINQRGHLVNPTFCTDTGKTDRNAIHPSVVCKPNRVCKINLCKQLYFQLKNKSAAFVPGSCWCFFSVCTWWLKRINKWQQTLSDNLCKSQSLTRGLGQTRKTLEQKASDKTL